MQLAFKEQFTCRAVSPVQRKKFFLDKIIAIKLVNKMMKEAAATRTLRNSTDFWDFWGELYPIADARKFRCLFSCSRSHDPVPFLLQPARVGAEMGPFPVIYALWSLLSWALTHGLQQANIYISYFHQSVLRTQDQIKKSEGKTGLKEDI